MLLIADSGGTKTDWLLGNSSGKSKSLRTRGLNPNVLDEGEILCTLRNEVVPWLKGSKFRKVHFFGAGLGITRNRYLLKKIIRQELKTDRVLVAPDMLGAAYAALGARSGVMAILGTGSVAFYYDGRGIKKRYGGWGYLLGDEGSGIALGRSLVRAYLERRLPSSLAEIYTEFIGLKRDNLIHRLYSGNRQNVLLAGQTYFLAQHQDDPWVRELLDAQFTLFFKSALAPCMEDFQMPAVLSGGVAEIFFDVLARLLQREGIDKVRLLKPPVIRSLFQHVIELSRKGH